MKNRNFRRERENAKNNHMEILVLKKCTKNKKNKKSPNDLKEGWK